MRTKKAIVSVCRRWYYIGIPFLYEDLALTSPPHAAFHAIQSSPRASMLAPLAKRFIIAFYVPEAYIKWTFRTFRNLHTFWDVAIAHPLPLLKSCISPNGTSLTHLILKGILPSLEVAELLCETSKQLLALEIPSFPSVSWNSPAISLPALQTLHICLLSSAYTICLPSLTALTTTFSFWDLQNRDATVFFRITGHKLKYLSISSRTTHYEYNDTKKDLHPLQGFLSQCPNVTHLVLKVEDIAVSRLPISHPNAEWIDVQVPLVPRTNLESPICQCGHCPDFLSRFTQANFPSLKNIRSICSSLAEFADLPRILPPSLMEDKVAFQCGDLHLMVTPQAIARVVQGRIPDDGTEEDQDSDSEDDDPDWQPDEESNSESSESESSDSSEGSSQSSQLATADDEESSMTNDLAIDSELAL